MDEGSRMEMGSGGSSILIRMSQEESRILASSIGETLEGVEEWKFQTRAGIE